MKRLFFVEMMGEAGGYYASVYDHFEDKENKGLWFTKRFQHNAGININTRNVCLGEDVPRPEDLDGLVLAGTYNSVQDATRWQKKVRDWLPEIKTQSKT